MMLRTPLAIGSLGLLALLALAPFAPRRPPVAGGTKAVEIARTRTFGVAEGDVSPAGGELFVPMFQRGGHEALGALDPDRGVVRYATGPLDDQGLAFVAADGAKVFAATPHALRLYDRHSLAQIASWPEEAPPREIAGPQITYTVDATFDGRRLLRLVGPPPGPNPLPLLQPPEYRLETIDAASLQRRTLWEGRSWTDMALWGDKVVAFDSNNGQLQIFNAAHTLVASSAFAPLPQGQDTGIEDVVRLGGRHMVVLSRGHFLVIDLAAGRLESAIPTFDPTAFYAFAIDGDHLIAFPVDAKTSTNGAVFDLATGRRLATLRAPAKVEDIAVGDGRMTLLLTDGGTAALIGYRLDA